RLDHLDPDAYPGRGFVSHDLYRRLRDGKERPRRRGPLHRSRRLLDRGHIWRAGVDRPGAAACDNRPSVRTARIYGIAGARVDLPRLHVIVLIDTHPADGLPRTASWHDWHRQHDRPFPLQLRSRGIG